MIPLRKKLTKNELVVATKNEKKLQEIKYIFRDLNIQITSLKDFPGCPRVVENGNSFNENAIKKALTIAKFTKRLTLGEDSGLEVEALGGKPGIYSSRFAGPRKSDSKNNLKLLHLLGSLPFSRRKAHYYCSVALADKDRLLGVVQGSCSGMIGFEPKGNSGFGYDPLFMIPKFKKTFAQLGPQIKHKMSHRYRALSKAKKIILTYLRKSV